MCILFVKLIKSPRDGGLKLIIASNRDEFFRRPSKPAHFWAEDSRILGGRDMTEAKEGGTWLAASTTGRIGVVLNLSGSEPDPGKLGRGFLIADFLTGERDGKSHLEALSEKGSDYNKFHLVTIDCREEPILSHYSNGGGDGVSVTTDGVFAVGNSPLAKPYRKVVSGRERFEKVIERCRDRDELVRELLSLLKWEERHVGADEMGHLPKQVRETFSSVYIDAPSIGYGTRTHTIILVDADGKADFHEWTLKEPINPANREWVESHHTFRMG